MKKSPDGSWLTALAVIAAVVLLAAACSSDTDDDASSGENGDTTAATTSTTTTSTTTSDDSTTTTNTTTTTTASASSAATSDAATSNAARGVDSCSAEAVAPVSATYSLASGGHTYTYSTAIPSGYSADNPTPIVVLFHGLGGNGEQAAFGSGYADLAEQENFVLVYPDGLDTRGVGANWELLQLDEEGRDDVEFTRAMLEDVKQLVCVDENRIYSTGMSNGGFFSAVIACELSDVFAATFSVAGMTHPEGCQPSNPIAMGFIHGTADSVVSYSGAGSVLLAALTLSGSFTQEEIATFKVFFEQSMPVEIAEFAADMGCDEITDTDHSDDTQLRRFAGCDDSNVEVVFYTVQDGQHVWPGGFGTEGQTTEDFDATVDGWAFLSQFTLNSRS